MENKSDLLIAIEELREKKRQLERLPEYQEFLELSKGIHLFNDFIFEKREQKTIKFINELAEDEERLVGLLGRISTLEGKLIDIQFKKGFTGGPSNIMDYIFEIIIKGDYSKVPSTSGFSSGGFKVGNYTIEMSSGQGEYFYSIYKQQRIY